MINRVIESYNRTKLEELSNSISFDFGIRKDNDVYESQSSIDEDYLRDIIADTLDLIKKKVEENLISEMEFSDKTRSNINVLEFTDPMENNISGLRQESLYSNIPKDRGDILFIILKYTNGDGNVFEFHFLYNNSAVSILRDKRQHWFGDAPIVLTSDDAVVIEPNHLISIHDISYNHLIIKDVPRAEKVHNLGAYFELKAREILSETVLNYETIPMSKKMINLVLKNKRYFTLEYINENYERFIQALSEVNLVPYLPEEEIFTERALVFEKKNDLKAYIKAMSTFYSRHNLQSEEEPVQVDV